MRSPGAVPTVLAALVLAAACGKTSRPRSVFAPIGTIGLTSTFPANGSVDVEPSASIRLTLVSPVESIPSASIVIEDNGVRLAGAFAGASPTRVWTWRPALELPRGATITVRVATGIGYQTAASFSVREAGPEATVNLPGVVATGVRIWRSGRRAVLSADATYEVTTAGGRLLPTVVPPRAWTYGDDRFAYTEPDAPQNPTELVRRDLSGREERVALPFPRPIAARNQRGDVVLFVTSDVGTPNDWGPWRLRADEAQWQWLGPLARSTAPDIDIDAEGNVVVAFLADAQLNVQRFVVDRLVPETYWIPAPDHAFETALDLAGDGSGVFAWRDERFHAVKFTPALGLQEVDLFQARPLTSIVAPTFTRQGLADVLATAGGDAIVFTNYTQTGFEFVQRGVMMQRIHPSNPGTKAEVADASLVFGVPARESRVSRERGEVWSLLRAIDGSAGFSIERSAPGRTFQPLRDFYPQTLPGNVAGRVEWTFDDSGRALFAINELGSPTCRVVTWQ